MYFDTSSKKFGIIAAVVLFMAMAVSYTFVIAESQYGSLRLPFAVGRFLELHSLRAWYGASLGFEKNTKALAAVVMGSSSTEVASTTPARAVPVLIYHALPVEEDGHNVTRASFASHMKALYDDGWRTITLTELEAFLQGDLELPEKSFLLTFDDGARNSYYPSDPVRAALGLNAVSFILPKFSSDGGTHYYLSKGEIEEMLQSGRWEIGSHGQDAHDVFPAVDDMGTPGSFLGNYAWKSDEGRLETEEEYRARVRSDFIASRKNLQVEFGIPIRTFAFPFGEYGQLGQARDSSEELLEEVKRIYHLAFYQTWPGEGFSQNYLAEVGDDPLMVKRIEVRAEWSAQDLLERIGRGTPKDLPYTDTLDQDLGWFANWSQYEMINGEMHLSGVDTQTGSAVVLDGTGDWKDYRFNARVESTARNGIVLWARFQNNENNASCNFGNGFVHVEETLDGTRRVIEGNRASRLQIPAGQFEISIEVQGRNVFCYLNDTLVAESRFLDTSLTHGGIGIKVWDPIPGRADVTVYDVEVK